MTMTRQQLEDVIERQLTTQFIRDPGYRSTVDASRRAILAAVDDWTASQVAAAVTPPAFVMPDRISRRALRQFRQRLAKALNTTTGGNR